MVQPPRGTIWKFLKKLNTLTRCEMHTYNLPLGRLRHIVRLCLKTTSKTPNGPAVPLLVNTQES